MPTLGEWDSWLERSKAKFAPYEVPEEEREQALSEGNVGQYPGDDPEKFLKSGRKEFSQLRADRLALVDQVNKARSKENELHPYPKLERAFSAVTGSVPSFLSPDVPAPDIPAQPTPDRVVTPVRPPKPEAPQAQREPAIIGSSAQQALPSNSPPLGTRQDDRFGLRQVAPLDVRGMQRTIREKSADLTRRRAELDDLQGQLDKVNPQFQIRTGQYPALTDEEREQYDVTRNVFNQKAQEFNAQRDEYNRLTRQFNKKIDAHARQQVTPQIRPAIDRFGSSMDFGTPDTVVQNQPVATPKPRSFGEALTLATNNLFQGAAGIPADILKSIAIASKDVDAWLPEALKDKRPVEDRLTYKMGQAVERVAKRAFPSDPESRKEFMIGVLPQAVGSMAAFMTGGLAGAATKSPALVGGAISSLMGAGAQGTQQYEEAKSFGADEPTQRKAFWLGSAVGSSESLPIAGLLNRFNKATGGGFFKVLKESGVTAAQEFIQEWGQQVGSNAIAKELYDENRGLLEGAGISGAAGGVTGAVAGLLSGVIAGRKIRKQQQAHEGSKTTESPFAEEPTLRTTPLRMPQPTQPSMQQTVPLSPSPHDLIASIPSDLTVSQRPPFLIRKGPMASAVSAVPTPSPMPPATPEAIPLAPNPIEPIETPAAQAMSAMPAATPDSVGREPNIVQQQTIPIRTIPLEPEPREPRIVQEPTVQTRPVSITPDSLQGSASPSTQGPSVEEIHDLADRKGIAWDNNRQFMDLTEDVTGKRHLDDLTGPERAEMVQAIEHAPSASPVAQRTEIQGPKAQQKAATTPDKIDRLIEQYSATGRVAVRYPLRKQVSLDGRSMSEKDAITKMKRVIAASTAHTPDMVVKPETAQAATTPDTVFSNPLVQQPRSELPIEQNMEMQLRAEKAQADMEIAGQERGGRTFIEQHGHGSTPETIGFKSATADWYKELTNGPRPLKRAQIDAAIQKIIKDHGVDVGVAVERVKEALLGDHEFNKTPWGKDAESIRQGEWPSWIEKPTGQAVPTPDEALTKAVPQQGGPVSPSVPTPDLALTAPFVKPDESPNKKAKVEPTDLSTASYSDLVRMMENGVESRRRLRDLPPVQKQEAMGFVESGMKPTASNIKQWLESQGTIGYVETTVKQIQKNYKDAFAAKREGDANRELSEREKSGDLSPRKQKQTETPPTPDLVLTATQSRPTNERSQPTPKSEQMSIYVPPETIGSRPIIGREAQPEEAPLFSKAAQEPEVAQTELPGTTPDEVVTADTRQAPTPDQVTTVSQRAALMTEQHKAFMRRLYEGDVSLDEYKQAFQQVRDSQDAITTELSGMTKEQLIKLVGMRASRSENKAGLVRQAYDSLLADFSIGRGVSYMMTGGKDGYDRALTALVNKTTEQDLKQFSETVAKQRADRKARIEGLKNPQTLEDFETRVRVKGESSLSPEQLARYDELLAQAGRERRKQAQERQSVVQGVDAGADVQLIESKHTKTGEPLWVVKLANRVDRAVYDLLNQAAHKLGGRYSSYNKDGAVPGFTFRSKDAANSFMAAAKGESVSSAPVQEATTPQVQHNAVANLREMADRLDGNADEILNADRKTNTARRARMASNTENAAYGDKAQAATMRNLADAIESGEATHLSGLRTKAQVEMLDVFTERAKFDRDRKRFKDYSEQDKQRHRKAEPEDAAHADFPDFDLLKDRVMDVIRDLTPIKGTERIRLNLAKAMNRVSDGERVTIGRDLAESAMAKYPKDSRTVPPWQWTEARANLKRLESMGITSLPELRAALREFVQYRGQRGTIDKATQLERNLIGRKDIGNDFFPTPRAMADRMVREADIRPGMKVLEPSAGNGNIAEAIKAAGVNPDVVEISDQLRDVLEAKGFNLVGRDFMDVTEGGYDRIVMNPPFSNGQDAEHIQHAYSLLKPGGKLVAIAGEGIFSRNDTKAKAFREWLDEQGGTDERLPEGAFKDTALMATTGANARMISLTKPGDERSVGEVPHELAKSWEAVAQARTPDVLSVVSERTNRPKTTTSAPVPHEVDLPKAKENTKVDNVSQPKQVKANKPIDELSAPDRLANRAKGIPRAADPPIASYQNNDQVKAHKDYRAAKSGDSEAAFRLVRDMVKPETAQEVQKRFPGSIFIAPLSQEASGLNAIPKTLAAHYADLAGGMADSRIKQVNKTFHTGADPMERILARPIFEGPVTPGGKYVLVDDVITMGGTLAELANHIRQGGGEVVGIAALTNASRSGRLTPSKHHVRLIEERFGDALREEFGIEPAALTGPESGYLVNFRDADELRTRSARAKEQRTRRLSAKEVSRPQDHPVADTPSPKSEQNITELSAPDRSEPAKKAESSSSAKEIADLFKQESEHAKNAVRPTQPRIPIAPITGGPSTPIGEIILNLEKGTGKKLTIGKTRSGTAGVYKPGSSATIIKYSGDLDITAHEMSHALDDQYGLVKEWKGQDTSPFDAELEPFAQHGSSDPNASPTYNRAEGVAEYIRAWLVNPAAAEAAAPQFTAHVKAKLPTEVQKALKTFSTQMRQWYGNTAHAKIMANVQWETPETGLTQWLAGSRTAKGPGFQLTFGDQMATAWTDRLAPFMKALQYAREQRGIDREPLLPGNDPALLSRLFMGINAKLDDIFAHGMVDSRLERATPGGLSWLLEPLDQTSSKALEADMQEVASLMIAQRTVEKAEQLGKQRVSGIGAGIDSDMAVAEARLAELKKDEARYAKLKEAASRYRQWADANLRYLVEKGRLSQKQYEVIKANNEQYVAMQRVLEVSPGEELAAFMPRGAPSRKLGAVGTPVHGFEGSTRTIKNPYLSLMDATHRSIREADRNEIMKLFRDLLTTDRGLYEGEPTNLATVGREGQAGEQQTIPIFVNGKKEIWQFHPDVYKALKGIEDGTYALPPFLTILPRILRATIVNTPAFALRNVIRDAWQRSIASLSGSKPWDTLKVYSKEEISQLKRSGGDQAGHYYTDSKNYARAMKFAMQEAMASHNSIVVNPSKLLTWVKQGGQGYLDLMQGSERQGRLSEYRRAFRKAKKQFGYDDYHAMLYAASQSRGLIDYAIAGNTMSLINQLIPFSNAAVQGLRSNLLRAKADPAGFALRFGVFALVPALMNYAWNYLYDGDDLDEYRQLPAYQRDLFWNFKLGPDLWLKVPKPFELGVMASSFERMLDYSTGNTKAFDGHVGAFLRTLLPVDDASLAGPYQSWLQAATNYDFFRDRPIVPRWEENLALDLRNYHRASRLGQALQQAVGVDARKIDFLLQSQFGYVGRYAVDISDTGRKDKHGLTLSASGVTGGSPASVSIDAKEVSKIAEERGVVPSRSKAVDRVTNMSQITTRNAKHPDSLRYAVFRKHLNEYYKAESREDRDRLAKQVRTDAKYLRDLWEKQPPRPEADDKIKKKRAIESEYDPFLDLMGFPQPLSKHPTSTLHELVP